MKKIEILSPAGSYESLKAAIAAGADAVYIGGTRFGARAFADNLTEDKLLEAIDYVHLHGKKIYLTVNTLLKQREIENELYDYLLPYYKHGIDAVIVQDLGVMKFVKEYFPDLPIHASTQMTVNDVLSAKFLEEQGVERVVTSREMHIDEIRKISLETNLEIESFVHGALCYCYSGQCLYSSLIGGRSGNRGQCAQPCRLPYKIVGDKQSQYILSLKDICTLDYIPEILESGICSLKIEGRMKKPEYVALVTAMYRKYVDLYLKKGREAFRVESQDKERLLDLYNRGGFHSGYYHTHNGREMVSLDRPNHAGVPALKILKVNGRSITAKAIVDMRSGDVVELPDQKENYTLSNSVKKGQNLTFVTHQKQKTEINAVLNRTRNESLIREIKETIIDRKPKEKIKGKLILSATEPAKLTVRYQNILVEVFGEKAQKAVNQPIEKERIVKQLNKTGNTEFEFEAIDVILDGKLFVPMQMLNEMRRQALEQLEQKILSQYRRECKKFEHEEMHVTEEKEQVNGFYVYVEEIEQFEVALKFDSVRRIYLDANAVSRIWKNMVIKQLIEKAHTNGMELYLALPHIFREKTKVQYTEHLNFLLKEEWDGFLVRNIESFMFLKEQGYSGKIVLDYSIYHFNQHAKHFWHEQSATSYTAPLELNYKELAEVGLEQGELIVYGYLPMMVSAQCITKTTKGCSQKRGRISFVDRYQKRFTAKNHCDYCYNVIYNTAPLMLLDQNEEISMLNPMALRLHFTLETASEAERILKLYEMSFVKNEKIEMSDLDFTRGHFKRGIK